MKKLPSLPRYTTAQLRDQADSFRDTYSAGKLPVDIMAIIEFDLKMEIRPVPGLKQLCGMDALLMSNMDVIYIDSDQYMDERYDNRLRFSLAHELGHRVLHRRYYEDSGILNIEDVHTFIASLSDEDYGFLEWHANEFAGRLLVPPKQLKQELKKLISNNEKSLRALGLDLGSILDASAARVAGTFGVSEDVSSRRIDKENIAQYLSWDE